MRCIRNSALYTKLDGEGNLVLNYEKERILDINETTSSKDAL